MGFIRKLGKAGLSPFGMIMNAASKKRKEKEPKPQPTLLTMGSAPADQSRQIY